MKKLVTLLFALVFFNATANTWNDGFNWAGKETTAKPKWYFLNDMVDAKEYQRALSPTIWLLQNTPELHKSLYIQASKVLEANVKLEKDPSRKVALQDSALWVYDQRIALYGEEAKCLNKKGKIAFKYLYQRKGSTEALYSLYAKIYQLNDSKMYIKNSTYYFRASENMFVQHKITKTELLAIYSEMISFLDKSEITYSSKPKKIALIEKQRTKINNDFDKNVPLNCEEVTAHYGEKYTSNPNLADAKKINGFLAKEKCFDNPLFIKTNEDILAQEPDAKRYAAAAIIASNAHDYSKAYDYYEQAITLETRDTVKAKFYLSMARIKYQQDDYIKARSNARKSIAIVQKNTEAYQLIGDLYMSSGNLCTSSDVLKQKAIYIAAYNMYKKAGASNKMSQAKQQFPTMEEIFVRNQKEGDTIQTGCWINESVRLEKK